MRYILTGVLALLMAFSALAETFPAKDWVEKPDPIASPNAKRGGSISLWGHNYPPSFNAYLASYAMSSEVFGKMYSSLMDVHPVDLSFQPGIVRSWDISDDKKVFTLYIDPRAKWSDGRAITAHDIKWTVATILDPKNLTGAHKIGLSRFASPEVIDERTIRFSAKEVHWKNLLYLAGLNVLPKHVMEGQDFNKINFEFPVVNGPYRIKELKEGRHILLERNPDWWRKVSVAVKGLYNFDEIKYRFVADRSDAFAAFQKGEMDFYAVYTSRIWVKETSGEPFANNWIVKQKIYNQEPTPLQAYVFNLRKPLFQDVRVRKALALLMDRPRMNESLMYNQYDLHHSYFEDIYDAEHPNPHPLVPFDIAQARRLLDEAGWKVNPQTGIREKEGQRFSFTMLYNDAVHDRFFAIYEEALKDVGIEMLRERKDRSAWMKDMDQFNFEMTSGGWMGTVFKDAESMWYSKEADRVAGSNASGFKNVEVDRLIDASKSEFDVQKRLEMLREIDAVLVKESPYVLEWYAGYVRLLYWNKFGRPKTVLSKYDGEMSALTYWWYDEDKAEELEEAMEVDIALPSEPVEVRFDEVFKP